MVDQADGDARVGEAVYEVRRAVCRRAERASASRSRKEGRSCIYLARYGGK